jgi:TetR/AcrR family transcriptional regulator
LAVVMAGNKSRGDAVARRDSRAILFDATAALLSERSTIEVSLSEIAQRSGLNSALIKYYFGGKEGLLLALLDRVAERSMADLAHLVSMDLSAEQKLRIHIGGIINTYYRSPYVNRLINYMIVRGDKASSEHVAKIFVEPMVEAYRAIVDQGVADGTFRRLDPGMLYYSVVGACEHIFYAGYSLPTTLGLSELTEQVRQQYVQHVLDLVFHGVLASPSATG